MRTFQLSTNSMIEERTEIASPVNHSKDEHVLVFNAIDDQIFADGKAAGTNAQIAVA